MTITQPELDGLLADHRHYLESGQRSGGRMDVGQRSFVGLDFRGADLAESVMFECDFRDTNLTRADLSGSLLQGSDFRGARMDDVDLIKADVSEANFEGVQMNSVKLHGAEFYQANLRGVHLLDCINLIGTSFTEVDASGLIMTNAQVHVDFWGARLSENDFAGVRGLLSNWPATVDDGTGPRQYSGIEVLRYINARGGAVSMFDPNARLIADPPR